MGKSKLYDPLAKLMPLRRLNYAQSVHYAVSNFTVVILTRCDLNNKEGVYDSNLNVIGLNKDLQFTQKRCALVHELVHWAYDDPDGTHELRCRRAAALILVDPVEYQLAEHIYDTDAELIADALDVTASVIHDWQRMAHDNPRMLWDYDKAF